MLSSDQVNGEQRNLSYVVMCTTAQMLTLMSIHDPSWLQNSVPALKRAERLQNDMRGSGFPSRLLLMSAKEPVLEPSNAPPSSPPPRDDLSSVVSPGADYNPFVDIDDDDDDDNDDGATDKYAPEVGDAFTDDAMADHVDETDTADTKPAATHTGVDPGAAEISSEAVSWTAINFISIVLINALTGEHGFVHVRTLQQTLFDDHITHWATNLMSKANSINDDLLVSVMHRHNQQILSLYAALTIMMTAFDMLVNNPSLRKSALRLGSRRRNKKMIPA